MNKENPLFSIIIPVYNPNVKYLNVCLESLLSQTFHNYEIIIIDDGSEQAYRELLDRYSRDYKTISLFHQNNSGVSVARNNGIKHAKGKWIIFVDADDWLEINALECLRGHLIENDCDILLFKGIKEFSSHHQIMEYGLAPNQYCGLSDVSMREKLYKRAMSTPNIETEDCCVIYYSWDKVYARRFLLNYEIQYPTGIANSEDKVFILRCFEKMKSIYVVDDALYHYRINYESASKRYNENADAQRIKLAAILEEISKRMDKELSELTGILDYHKIYDEYMRFCFGIISDVLNYKFYHPNYPRGKKCRRAEVKAFLSTYPFSQAIRYVKFKDLSSGAKLKKLLLMLHLSSVFFFLKNRRMKKAGEIPM